MSSFYADLEVTSEANSEQIASAYRRLSLQLHPLRNPVDQKAFFTAGFAKVSQAYEVLSHAAYKQTYDKLGYESLAKGTDKQAGYTFMGNPFKIFFDFFGSENPWFDQLEQVSPMTAIIAEAEKSARAADVEVTVDCSLFEFYNGALKEVLYMQTEAFDGSEESDQHEKTIMIQVKAGYGEHTTLRFPRLGNKSFGAHPSDLVIRFALKEPTGGFVRKGNDLYYHVNMSLIEALESKPATIKTLDGRSILVTPNEMITPQTQVVLEKEGMPAQLTGNFVVDAQESLQSKQECKKGNLIVRYNIAFPKKILNHHKETILAALHAC